MITVKAVSLSTLCLIVATLCRATGCSGTNAVRYGTAKAEWFLQAVSFHHTHSSRVGRS